MVFIDSEAELRTQVCAPDLVADLPEGREGVMRVPQLYVVRSVEGEQNIMDMQRHVGQRLVLQYAHQPCHQLETLRHTTFTLVHSKTWG